MSFLSKDGVIGYLASDEKKHTGRWANAMRGFSTEERNSWNDAYPDLVSKEVIE